MAGFVTSTGVYAHVGGAVVALPPVHMPLAAVLGAQFNLAGELPREVANGLRDLCDAILRGEVEPCPVCGRFDCDMDEWHDLMHCDVAGDLDELRPGELPY